MIPLVSCLSEALTKISPRDAIVVELKNELRKNMNKQFDKLEFNSFMALVTTLDPRFKLLHFKHPLAKSKTVFYLNSFIRDGKNDAGTSESSDEYEKEEQSFDIWIHHKHLAHQNIISKQSNLSTITTTEVEVQMHIGSAVAPTNQNPIEMWDDMKTVCSGVI